MLHGDVKPENVIVVLDDQGQVEHARLIDFGLAFKSRGLMQRNMYIQSRWYRSPEVLLGIPVSLCVLWLLSQCIILIFRDVVGFLVSHIQVGPFLLVLQHLLHVVIALGQRLLFIGTLLGSFVGELVRRLRRSRMTGLRRRILSRSDLA